MRRLTRRHRIAGVVLAVLALSFTTLDLGGSGLKSAHDGVRGSLGALYRGTDAVLGPARRFLQGVPSAGTNQSKIRALEQENARLRRQLAARRADASTRAQLAKLQLAATVDRHRILPARVIALGPGGGFDWTVTLDVGRTSGVSDGQTVTDGAGLAGRVLHADDSTSLVLLAADPGSGVGARDLRSRQVGVATGRGSGGYVFVPLDPKAVVRVGDRLATGPAGASSYVAGLDVGVVSAVRRLPDGTTQATVRAAVSPTALDLVGVILPTAVSSPVRVALEPGR